MKLTVDLYGTHKDLFEIQITDPLVTFDKKEKCK